MNSEDYIRFAAWSGVKSIFWKALPLSEFITIVPENEQNNNTLRKLCSEESVDKVLMKVYVNNLIKSGKLNESNITEFAEQCSTDKGTSGTILDPRHWKNKIS